MSKVISVVNQKGGVGKTTTAVNLSACLANIGSHVLIVDLDPQGNASSGLQLKAGSHTVYEALLGQCAFKDAVTRTLQKHLDGAPTDIRMAGAELELAGMEKREFCLKEALAPVRGDYDYILIDCPPSLGLITVNALAAADSVLIPIQCEYYALEGVSSLINTISRIKKSINPHLETEGVVLTMFDGRTNLSLQVAAEVKKHFKNKVFSSVIPRNVRLGEAPSHGLPIHLYDPKSAGAEAYSSLARELIKRNRK
ncbi:MAG: ParA family protein [Clostridia bacterium]|nr:ParA family protein [Clostridia bacterium]